MMKRWARVLSFAQLALDCRKRSQEAPKGASIFFQHSRPL